MRLAHKMNKPQEIVPEACLRIIVGNSISQPTFFIHYKAQFN